MRVAAIAMMRSPVMLVKLQHLAKVDTPVTMEAQSLGLVMIAAALAHLNGLVTIAKLELLVKIDSPVVMAAPP